MQDQPEDWPVLASTDISRGDAPFAVRRDVLTAPGGGEPFARLVVEHPGAVVVLAVDDEDRALVLRQYRHAARTRFVELPAGLLDQPGEDPLVAARRELREEAALEASTWEHLTTVSNSPGFTDERVVIYLARGLRPAGRGDFVLEHEEADMTAHWVPVADLTDAVLDGRVSDGPVVIAVLRLLAWRRAAGESCP